MRVRCVFAVCLIGALWACAAPSLRDVSVFIEGEDFEPDGPEWFVGRGWNDDIYTATSGDAVIGSNGGPKGQATKTVTIPADGKYNVWVRYLRIGTYKGSFGLKIEQGGKVVFDAHYRENPQGTGWKPEWEKFEAQLSRGEAKLTLYIARPGIRQRIDCVLLTPRLDYQPDYTDFAPQVFVRLKVEQPAAPWRAQINAYHHRAPRWYAHGGWLSADGMGSKGEAVAAGAWSPWYDISKLLDGGGRVSTVKLRFTSPDDPPARVAADFEVAPRAEEDSVLVRLHEDLDGDIISLIIPGDIVKYPSRIELASAQTKRHLATAEGFGFEPPQNTARIALETPLVGWNNSYHSRQILRAETRVCAIIGFNSLENLDRVPRRIANEEGIHRSWWAHWIPYQCFKCWTDPKNEELIDRRYAKLAAELAENDPQAAKQAYRNKLYDEPHGASLKHMADCPTCLAAFHRYLQARGLKPDFFGQQGWEQVKPLARGAAQDLPTRRLHYWSIQFRDQATADLFRLATALVEKHFGKDMLTSVNFTNGPVSGWLRSMVWGPDWFLFGRERAQSLMWSEDWTSLGPDGTGYPVDILRSAGRPHDLPVGMYIIANDGKTLAQRTFSALMHGAKYLCFYCYGPYYAFNDGGLSEHPENQRILAQTIRDVIRADELLWPARPAQARVAIIWSKSGELWEKDGAIGTERRITYLALAHTHTPVDFLCEHDVEQGGLTPYRAAYLLDSGLTRRAAKQVRDWVRGGGVLYGCAGAGTRDEYDEPLETLGEVFGARSEEINKPGGDYRERYGLRRMKATAQVKIDWADLGGPLALAAYGYREKLTPTTGQVVATFEDGSPAGVVNRLGQGRALRLAFLPALAYSRAAEVSTRAVATGFPAPIRNLIASPVRLAEVQPPLEVSDPLVEANLMTCGAGAIVPLANWNPDPLERVDLRIQWRGQLKSVGSIKLGALKYKRDGDWLTVSLPLRDVDAVIVRQ